MKMIHYEYLTQKWTFNLDNWRYPRKLEITANSILQEKAFHQSKFGSFGLDNSAAVFAEKTWQKTTLLNASISARKTFVSWGTKTEQMDNIQNFFLPALNKECRSI